MLRGKRLQEFKLGLKSDNVNDIDVVNQAPQLDVFNFRSYLNLAIPKVQDQMIHLDILLNNPIAKS